MNPDVGAYLAAYAPRLGSGNGVERQVVVAYLALHAVVATILLLARIVRRRSTAPSTSAAPPPALLGATLPPGVRELEAAELAPVLLGRIARLKSLDAQYAAETTGPRRRLVQAALLSTYRDCEALGLAAEANP